MPGFGSHRETCSASDTEAFGHGELEKVVLLGSKFILNVFCVAFLPFPSVALCFSN